MSNENIKNYLQDEMRQCCEDMKYYTEEKHRAKAEGNDDYCKNLEFEIEKAQKQYDVARIEYVNKFGVRGVVQC